MVPARDEERRAHVAGQLATQATACRAMGSPMYATLLDRSAQDCRAGGPVWAVLGGDVRPGRGDAMALRFMAAVHRLVLTRRAPALALHYPSVGGQVGDRLWDAFHETVDAHREELVALVARPCQTNEVGRCAALSWGFLLVAAQTGLPLRCLEIGASGGLNLRWDRFRYGTVRGTRSWGPADSPVDLSGLWAEPPPALPAGVDVADRRGCDVAPVDVTTSDGRLALSASVWADMTDRFTRLAGALRVAAGTPAAVDAESAATWVPRMLAETVRGVATVVFHSVVAEYVPEDAWGRVTSELDEAGGRSTGAAPLAWVRLEPVSALRRHALAVTTWPGGTTRVLATSGAHGQEVRPPTDAEVTAALGP